MRQYQLKFKACVFNNISSLYADVIDPYCPNFNVGLIIIIQ